LTHKQQRVLGVFELFGFWRAKNGESGMNKLKDACDDDDAAACAYLRLYQDDFESLVEGCAAGVHPSCELITFYSLGDEASRKVLERLVWERLESSKLKKHQRFRLAMLVWALQWDQPDKWRAVLTKSRPWLAYASDRLHERRYFYSRELNFNKCLSIQRHFCESSAGPCSERSLAEKTAAIIGTCRNALSQYTAFYVMGFQPKWQVAASSRRAMIYFFIARWLDAQRSLRLAAAQNQAVTKGKEAFEHTTSRTITQLFEKGDKAYAQAMRAAFECDCGYWAVMQADQARKKLLNVTDVIPHAR
jgi:hypothetical protein